MHCVPYVATIAHHPEAAGLIKLEGPNAGSIVVPAGAISWHIGEVGVLSYRMQPTSDASAFLWTHSPQESI